METTRTRTIAQYTAFTLIASAALAACTIVGFNDNAVHVAETHTDTTVVLGGVPVPSAIQAELDATGTHIEQCSSVEGTNCYWDSVSRANNQGYSFINWDGKYYYGTDKGVGPDITIATCDIPLTEIPEYTRTDVCVDLSGEVVTR